MTDVANPALQTVAAVAPPLKARLALLRRLADVVCLPSSRVNTFERSVTGDVLVDLLRDADPEDRARVARRLSAINDIPSTLLRLLLRDSFDIARPLLESGAGLHDLDLMDCIRHGGMDHRRAIAARRGVTEVVAESLIERLEPVVWEALLKNGEARLSHTAVEVLVAASRTELQLIPLLLRRPELRPSHAYSLFWWADSEARRTVLQRFAVTREVLQDAVGDVFAMAAAEGWADPVARKTLQFIERRQRNRAAIARSPFESLDAAVAAAGHELTRETAEEISYLAGLKPMTGAKILTDVGGEPVAILCKATGLPKSAIRALWRGMRRPETDDAGQVHPDLQRVLHTYDMMAVDRAQTVLRYWNWSLSSALTPALVQAIREGDEGVVDEYSAAQRAAMLVLSQDLAI